MTNDISMRVDGTDSSSNRRCDLLRKDGKKCIYGLDCPSVENRSYDIKGCIMRTMHQADLTIHLNVGRRYADQP